MNAHDLDRLLACFDPQYKSIQPLNPERDFRGRETVRARWTQIFAAIPDFRAELLRIAVAADEEWAEWHWSGTRTNGTRMHVRGVTILGVRDGVIASGRFYLEDAERAGGGMHVE